MKLKNFHLSEDELNITDNEDEDVEKLPEKEEKPNDKQDKKNDILKLPLGSKDNPYISDMEQHKIRFLKLNKEFDEQDFFYLKKKLKRKKYIDFSKIEECNLCIPHGECIGKTMFRKKIYGKKPKGYFKADNGTALPFYDLFELDTDIKGYIPVGDDYILVTKKKITPIDFAVAFISVTFVLKLIILGE